MLVSVGCCSSWGPTSENLTCYRAQKHPWILELQIYCHSTTTALWKPVLISFQWHLKHGFTNKKVLRVRHRTRYFSRTEELGSTGTRVSLEILKSSYTLKVTVEFFVWLLFFLWWGLVYFKASRSQELLAYCSFKIAIGSGCLVVLKELFCDCNCVGNA